MIRKATPFDMPTLVSLMRGYVAEAPMETLKDSSLHDQTHIESLMASLMAGRGFILLDDLCRGFIAAMVIQNVWCPSVFELHELAWWVMPEHRGKSIGGRLWVKFDEIAQDMLNSKRVDFVCTTVMANSPLIDYTKRGYRPLEATFFRD